MSRLDRRRAGLQALEADFLERLLSNLERTASGDNTLFFVTSESCPPNLPRYLLSPETAELSGLADEIIDLRRALGEPDDSPARLFRSYLRRAAEQDANELGPIRMASEFLGRLRGAG